MRLCSKRIELVNRDTRLEMVVVLAQPRRDLPASCDSRVTSRVAQSSILFARACKASNLRQQYQVRKELHIAHLHCDTTLVASLLVHHILDSSK